MRAIETAGPWVVYHVPAHGKHAGMTALCSQREWDVLEQSYPGRHTLIKAGIANEGEAERLARATPPAPPAPAPIPQVSAATVFPVVA